jgi:hypothetical protein
MARGRHQSLSDNGNNPSSSRNNATPLHSSGNASRSGAVAVSTQLSHQQYEVPLLDDKGTKYTLWLHTMMLVLRHRGLWDVVNGTVRAPDATADPDAYTNWYNKDQEALLHIVVTLKDGPHNSILDANTLKECWDTLAK